MQRVVRLVGEVVRIGLLERHQISTEFALLFANLGPVLDLPDQVGQLAGVVLPRE
jgi:hypothetical protein